jgi:hypothetical protein
MGINHIAPSSPLALTSSLTRLSSQAPHCAQRSAPIFSTSISSSGARATPPVLESIFSSEESAFVVLVEERESVRREGDRRSSEREGSRIGGRL